MLQFIRNNETLSIILLIVITILLRLRLFIEDYSIDFAFNTAEPLSRLFYSSIINSGMDVTTILGIASILLVFFQAIWVNQILIKYKIFEKEGFLPAIIYVIFLGISPEFIQCSPILLSITFLIPVIDKLLDTYNKENCFKLLYDSGFLVGVASLFYFPAIFFMLFIYISLSSLRSLNIKEWLAVLVGTLSIYILVFTGYFLTDSQMFHFEHSGSLYSGKLLSEFARMDISLMALAGIILLTLLGTIYTSKMLTGTLIQFRKFIFILLTFGILGILSIVLPSNNHSFHLLFFMVPLSISFNNVFTNISKRYIADIIFFIIFLFSLILQYLPYFYSP